MALIERQRREALCLKYGFVIVTYRGALGGDFGASLFEGRNQSRAGERWIRSVDGRPGERAIFRPDPAPWSFA